MNRGGLWLKPTGETVTLPDGREAREASAFVWGQGPGYLNLRGGSASDYDTKGIGCLVETPAGELWAVRAMPASIAAKYLDTEDGKP